MKLPKLGTAVDSVTAAIATVIAASTSVNPLESCLSRIPVPPSFDSMGEL